MTLWRLLLRNLLYHWRGNSAVCLGVAVGTAVLTGALLVGDSLRSSLHALTLRRLGWIDEALTAPRFFRADLANELQEAGAAEYVVPAIMLQGMAAAKPAGTSAKAAPRTARHVNVVGVSGLFWADEFGTGRAFRTFDRGVWLNSTLARALGVSVGDSISINIQKPSAIPRETLLGRRDTDNLIDAWTLEVTDVLGDTDFGEHFSLRPELESPRIAYVSLYMMQQRLGLAGQANALLASGGKQLTQQLQKHLTLADWSLTLQSPNDRAAALLKRLDRNKDGVLQPREWRDRLAESVAHAIAANGELTRSGIESYYRKNQDYLSLESRHIILEPPLASAALTAAKDTGLRAAPMLIYLANSIRSGAWDVPYSVVAALDPEATAPLGPFLPASAKTLADDQIVLADWSGFAGIKPGDPVEVSYFEPEQHGTPRELTAKFRFAGYVPLSGVSGDSDLTPEFPGITDKLDLKSWDPPFPYDNKRVKKRDEDYWREYRTTPKAYVTLKKGQELWGSRFGNLTSIRLAGGTDLQTAKEKYTRALLQQLEPARGGFVFEPVKADALQASAGGTDFSGLFIGFSFFLIVAALLLVGLLFRLNLDRRAAEVGLLLATGYRSATVRRLLLAEGGVIALGGTILGTAAAMAYAGLLVRFLGAIWPGGQLATLLQPHFTALSLALGAVGSLVVSVLTIAWAVRVLGKVAPPALLRGQTATPESAGPARIRWSRYIIAGSLLLAAVLEVVAFFVKDHEMQAGAFFGSGSLLLTACLAGLWAWLRGSRQHPVEQGGWWGVAKLGVRNAARYPSRSLLTAGLLASAAFLLVVVEAFRRHADAASTDIHSGSGGFALLGESDLPIFADLNNEAGRAEMAEKLVVRYRDALDGDNAKAQERVRQAMELLQECAIYPFRVRAGDDASCLNLYQPRTPKLLGVPEGLIDRGGFQFAATAKPTAEESNNAWLILNRDGKETPVFGENNTVVWMLHKSLDGTLTVTDGKGAEQTLRIDGLLQDSIFQSGLLMSGSRFLQLYPNQEGFTFFLIRTPTGREREVKDVLDLALTDRGFEATPTAERLDAFLAVENTYLSTFQALGGLGLILGSLGLAVVLLRGVWERRAELALLRALGWRRLMLGWLVLAENGFLLLVGVGAGAVSALLAIAPQAAQTTAPPLGRLVILLAVALGVGLGAGVLAVAATLRAPLVPALRRE